MSSFSFFIFVLTFSSTFFFSGIICSEYKKKTGFAIVPLLKRHELLIGKFFANYVLNIGVAAVHYVTMVLFGFYLYGPPVFYTTVISFGLVMLYILALSSFITFFSSFMPSPASVIVLTLSMFFFGFPLIQSLIQPIFPQIEPLYSFFYLFSIITQSFNPELSYEFRYYIDTETGEIWWGFPTIEAAILSFIIYFIIFFMLALYIFKKKQL
jgi:ABC-type transport system involved in multi-copper enzyme maturation permease subunit